VIFTDDVVNRGLTNGPQEIAYATEGEHLDVYELEVERRMVPSGYMVQDYNYRTPLAEITGSDQLEVGCGGGVIEFGAHHKNKIEGDRLATVRAQERQSGYEVYSGKSSLATLTAGATPVLTGHPILDDTRLLVVEVEHDATFAAFEQGGKPGEGAYKNQFQAIRADVHYRPPRVTPRPRIYGLVTGIVQPTHDVGGLARIDEEGRYSVQLYFDTVTHEGEEKASHPIRMAQPFAGPNHGMHFPLRPGAEVVIAFMDGDPDRPIIVGSVPNAVARAAVTAADSKMNRIHGTSGIVIEFSQGK
jgi:type VI secretion system secreted protein VgrG